MNVVRDGTAQPASVGIRARCTHLAGYKVLAGEGLHSQDRLLLRGEAPHSHTLGAAHTGWELPHSPVAARHILVAACCTSAHTDNVCTTLQAGCISTPAFGAALALQPQHSPGDLALVLRSSTVLDTQFKLRSRASFTQASGTLPSQYQHGMQL